MTRLTDKDFVDAMDRADRTEFRRDVLRACANAEGDAAGKIVKLGVAALELSDAGAVDRLVVLSHMQHLARVSSLEARLGEAVCYGAEGEDNEEIVRSLGETLDRAMAVHRESLEDSARRGSAWAARFLAEMGGPDA